MADRGSPPGSESTGFDCPHAHFCRCYYFNFNGTLVCLMCDVTKEGERDPDAAPATEGTPH